MQASHSIRGSRLKIHPKVESLLNQVEDLKIILKDKKPIENLHSEFLNLAIDDYHKENEKFIRSIQV